MNTRRTLFGAAPRIRGNACSRWIDTCAERYELIQDCRFSVCTDREGHDVQKGREYIGAGRRQSRDAVLRRSSGTDRRKHEDVEVRAVLEPGQRQLPLGPTERRCIHPGRRAASTGCRRTPRPCATRRQPGLHCQSPARRDADPGSRRLRVHRHHWDATYTLVIRRCRTAQLPTGCPLSIDGRHTRKLTQRHAVARANANEGTFSKYDGEQNHDQSN